MPVDFTTPEGAATPNDEAPMFAPIPVWDRSAKKRGSGRSSLRTTDPTLDAGEAGISAAPLSEPADTVYETQPATVTRTTRRSGVPAGALAAGLVAVAAIGAVGWYAARPHDTGVAQLTPGAPATSELALNTATPATVPTAADAATAAPATAPPAQSAAVTRTTTTTASSRAATPTVRRQTTTTVASRTPTHRARPAQSSSAYDASADASATASAPAPAPAATAPVPMTATPPAPAPMISTPAPEPAAPATASEPAATP